MDGHVMTGLLLSLFVFSFIITAGIKTFAMSLHVVDIPNERSAHHQPLPRGGGVAFVVSFVGGIFLLHSLGLIPTHWTLIFATAGLLMALVGFLDDRYNLSSLLRLYLQIGIVIWVLFSVSPLPELTFLNYQLPKMLVLLLAGFYLLWLINLYNFMDGIDALAAMEAIFVCIGGALIYGLTGHIFTMIYPLLLAAAVCGFFYWNFPPAKIFMGDAGSCFLGIILGIMSIQAWMISLPLFCSWFILLGFFITDATFTLLRRSLQGDKIYQAHRNHAYQHASRRFGSHLKVMLAIACVNVFWLLPVAICVGKGFLDGFNGILVAYLPLVVLVYFFNAGKTD